jgi:hypothetical protein
LNTGGAELSEQEVRNCVAVMLDKEFYDWLAERARNPDFVETIDQTEYALKQQSAMELALRFFVFRNVPYEAGLDVHEYLDNAMIEIATGESFNRNSETDVFNRTFNLLHRTLGDKSFKRWNGTEFVGKFLMSMFEVVATGVSRNLVAIEEMDDVGGRNFIIGKSKALWEDLVFQRNSGAGIRGTTRLTNLLPIAEPYFRP